MTTVNRKPLVLALVALPLVGVSFAATSFNAPLTSLPSQMNIANPASVGAVTFGSNGATFASPGDNERNYLRTNATDFGAASFTAFLTVTTTLGESFSGNSQLFFGLGTGARGEFGVPDRNTNHAVFLILNNQANPAGLKISATSPNVDPLISTGENQRASAAYNATAPSRTNTPTTAPSTATSTAIRLNFDSMTDVLTYALDYEYAGDSSYAGFTADQTISGSIPAGTRTAFNGAASSSLFFGGESAANDVNRVSNLSVTVVPEPSALALVLVGLSGMVARRKR